jgi:sugar/nucleoside kinase (ribokinase family)
LEPVKLPQGSTSLKHPFYVIAGQLRRDYLLPPEGRPLLDVPGGNMLYAASGARIWSDRIGLLSRIGEDYPQEWLKQFANRGFDTNGIRILAEGMDLRSFRAYMDSSTLQISNPVAHFARLGLPFPKSLLGFQPRREQQDSRTLPAPDSPRITDIPKHYLDVKAVHICPTDYVSQTQLLPAFHQADVMTTSLDPSPGYMLPAFFEDVRSLVHGLTAFMPSEEEIRSLFWGKTNDLWAMIEAIGSWGVEFVIIKRGGLGQMIYDATNHRRYEVPAYPARVVDPTGGGDAFCGGFIVGYAESYDPVRAALYGNVSSSLTLEGSGAFFALEALPGLAQARLETLKEIVREA